MVTWLMRARRLTPWLEERPNNRLQRRFKIQGAQFHPMKWLGRPLHPIVVHVPMAMWPGALIFDLLSQ